MKIIPVFMILQFVFTINIFGNQHNLSLDSLSLRERYWFPTNWKYHPGDSSQWANPDYDDSSWPLQETRLFRNNLPSEGWRGIGWFRLAITVDSSLLNKNLAIGVWQSGASEIYLNGDLLYKFGEVGGSPYSEEPYLERNPRIFRFTEASSQIMAVRYSNHHSELFHRYGSQAGFVVWMAEWNKALDARLSNLQNFVTQQNVFMIIPVILALVHILLFFHYPKLRENLYYSIMLLGFAFLIYFQFQVHLTASYSRILLYNKLFFISMMVATLAGLLTTYSGYSNLPRQFPVFAGLGTLVILLVLLFPSRITIMLILGTMLIILVEILRVMIFKSSKDVYGQWIVRIGFFVLFITVTYHVLTAYKLISPFVNIDYPYLIGIQAMLLATSVNMARDFALTSRNLEKQLVQVQKLSEKTIAQERLRREQEIQQRLLEEENQRKSRELEEARQLQVSMLPKPLEKFPGIEIFFQMQTATEVGGDYYDYHVSEDQVLTLAIGDATGHGMRAGTMVSVIKSLFVAESSQMELSGFMDKCHRTIRELRLGNLYMGLTLARYTDNQLSLLSAGMPPVFHYRRKENTLDEILMKVLPLGAPSALSLKPINIQMGSGDLLVFMSDGYPELFNSRQETFGIENVKRVIKENVDTPVGKIVDRLLAAGDRWREDFPQKDDITFIILKIT